MGRIRLFRRTGYFLLLALALWMFFFASPYFRICDTDSQIIGGFIEWFGVLYGLLLAMLLVEVWTNFNRVVEEIDKEADALQMLHWTAQCLRQEGAAQRISETILGYVDVVLDAGGIETQTQRWMAEDRVKALHRVVAQAITDSEHVALCTELLARINEARDTRGDRLAHARNRIPPVLWSALIVTSVIWLLAFFGLRIQSYVVSFLVVGGAVLVVVLLLLIIHDLSHHFSGVMVAEFEPFQTLRDNLNTALMEVERRVSGELPE